MTRALNGLLPADVRVLDAARVPETFSARRSATSKLYRYVMDTGAVQVPSRRRFAAHLPGALAEGPMRAAAALYLGRHDFASVASAGGSVKTTVRTISRSELRVEPTVPEAAGSVVTYEVEADGFLRKMVRSLVGGLVAAGQGRMSVDALHRALAAGDRRAWPAPAPARGLTLVRVDYLPRRRSPRVDNPLQVRSRARGVLP